MENSNKKRSSEINGDVRNPVKKIRAKKERSIGGVTAEDAELEEFLAILNRLQAAFNRFQKKDAGDGVGKSPEPPATTDFEVGDFIQFHDGCRKISAGDVIRNDSVLGFDLNVEPVSD